MSARERPSLPPESAAEDRHEAEWQFAASDLEAVEAWLLDAGAHAGVRIAPVGPQEIRDAYYDTEDWRIYRARFGLRIRRKGGDPGAAATLKSLDAPEANGFARRREIDEPLPHGEREALRHAPGPVGARVRALAGTRPLRLLFRIRTARRTFLILQGPGDAPPLGEVSLDRSTFTRREAGADRSLLRVEVEAFGGHRDDLAPFVAELRAACSLDPAPPTKYEAGCEAAGLRPSGPPEIGSTEVDPAMGIGEVAYAVLRRDLLALLAHEPGTRLGEDPEELHDMRVAARRLRAALRLFEEFLPPRAPRLRTELRDLGRRLGEVRDLDVQIADVRAFAPPEREQDLSALEPLLGRLRDAREEARRRMLASLDAPRTRRLVESMIAMLRREPPARTRGSRLPAVAVAPDLLRRRYKKLRKAGDRIDVGSGPSDYHRVRIQGKRLRYGLEFLEEVYGDAAHDLARRLARLQDLLGRHQDAQVAIALLRDLARARGKRLPAETVFLMGRVAENVSRNAERLRRRYPKAYRRVRGKPWKALRGAFTRERERLVASLYPPTPQPRPHPEGPSDAENERSGAP